MENILIVDDESDIRRLIKGILEDEGYKTRGAEGAKQAYEEIEKARPDLIVLDIWLQGSEQDGLQILSKIKKDHPYIPVLMISGHGTIETAVSSIKQGAYDFIEKPFKADRLLVMVKRALEASALQRENTELKKHAERSWEMIGASPAISELRSVLEKVALANSRVLITGEPGTGKEVVARTIHALSTRADKSFAVLSCASLHPERIEAELFGGGGILEKTSGGSLFLDEVADMSMEVQAKIVRMVQDQNLSESDVRIMASTSRDLEAMCADGKFRQDLFYRLNVVPVRVPPLRERIEDIPELVKFLSAEISKMSGLYPAIFSEGALTALRRHDWPGNIRQLKNVVEWSMIMRGGDKSATIEKEGLPPDLSGEPSTGGRGGAGVNIDLSLREAREAFERDYLLAQVERFDGNISKTAEFVGMERSALHRKLKSLQVVGSDNESGEKSAGGRGG